MARLFAAFLLGPWLAVALRVFWAAPGVATVDISKFIAITSRAALPIYLFALPIGLLAFAFALKIRRIGLLAAVVAGSVVALLFILAPTVGIVSDGRLNNWYKSRALADAAHEVLFGGCVGALIWLLGVWRNPALWLRSSDSAAHPPSVA